MKIFAYGSNMYSRRLMNRVKSAKFVAKGFLKQHKIAFHKISKDGSGKADCYFTGDNKDIIWGVVFEIADNEKPVLDKYEGLGNGYSV
jgi:gamma-glutamylcyclotransferase